LPAAKEAESAEAMLVAEEKLFGKHAISRAARLL
jgi:hypothetical protein